jgi:predicted PurR-regulated permease PerM
MSFRGVDRSGRRESNKENEMTANDHPNAGEAGKMPEERTNRQDVTHITLQILFIGSLIAAVGWILRPFLVPTIWAGMIVVTTWPILLKLESWLKNKRWLAATIMTMALLLVVFGPLLSALGTLIIRADDIVFWIKSLKNFAVPPPPLWLGTIPLVGSKLTEFWQPYTALGLQGLETYLAPYAMKAATWFVRQAGTVGMLVIDFLLTVFIAAMFYAKGEALSSEVCRFARRLGGAQGEAVTLLAARTIRSVALGVVVTALIQAAASGLGLAVTGVPAAGLLTAVMFILCLAQIGATPVLIPAVIWVYWGHGPLWGTILLVFAIVAVSLDNVVRPILIRKGADLPLVLILFGVIGGLIAFGVMGLFIGPVVLVVAYTLLTAWVDNGRVEEPASGQDEEEG